jgi:uncharacterized protein (UPF0305 family)
MDLLQGLNSEVGEDTKGASFFYTVELVGHNQPEIRRAEKVRENLVEQMAKLICEARLKLRKMEAANDPNFLEAQEQYDRLDKAFHRACVEPKAETWLQIQHSSLLQLFQIFSLKSKDLESV